MIDPLIRALERRALEGDPQALQALRHAWRRADALDGARGLAAHVEVPPHSSKRRVVWSEGGTWVDVTWRNARDLPIAVTVLVDDLDRVYRVATSNEPKGKRFRPGVGFDGRTIQLSGDCVAEAIDRYLAWLGFQVGGPRTIRTFTGRRRQSTGAATIYVDPSGSVDLGSAVRVPIAFNEEKPT